MDNNIKKLRPLIISLFFFAFWLLTTGPTAKAACPQGGCYCWCKVTIGCQPLGQIDTQANCNQKCAQIPGGSAIHYDETYIEYATKPECAAPSGPTPPTSQPTTAPANQPGRAAPSALCKNVNPTCMEAVAKGEKKSIFITSPDCYCCGNCGFNDIINLFINGAGYLLGLLGALALLFFIYGGVIFLTAGGKAEQIEKGKKILIGAVIGIALALGAWLIVKLLIQALGVTAPVTGF